eukprot:gene11350-biopygen2317
MPPNPKSYQSIGLSALLVANIGSRPQRGRMQLPNGHAVICGWTPLLTHNYGDAVAPQGRAPLPPRTAPKGKQPPSKQGGLLWIQSPLRNC